MSQEHLDEDSEMEWLRYVFMSRALEVQLVARGAVTRDGIISTRQGNAGS